MFVKTKAICYGYFHSAIPKIKLKDRCAMQQRAEDDTKEQHKKRKCGSIFKLHFP